MGIQINGQTDNISATDGSLTVSGADLGSASASSLNISGIVTASGFSGDVTGNLTGNVNASGVSTFSGGVVVAAGSTSAPAISPSGDSNTGIFFPSADTVAVATNSVERIKFGTTEAVVNDAGNDYDFRIEGDTNANLFFVDASTDRVGIGISSPSSLLHLSGSAAQNLTITRTSSISSAGDPYGYIDFIGANNVGSDPPDYSARIVAAHDSALSAGTRGSTLSFYTQFSSNNASERMRINSAGDILFGATARPNGTSVYGSAFTTQTNSRLTLFLATSSAATQKHAIFYNPNGEVGNISTNASATSYTTSSDYRLKENVAPLTGAVARIQQLKPSRFNFIADPDTVVDGFIAHEAAEIVPECVTGVKDEVDDEGNPVYQGIDQSKLVPLLTAALQEAVAEIEALKARLDAANL